MARNGSGTFNRLYDWVTDAAGGIKILASRMDDELDGMATALTNSIAKDGQTTPTADLPMGGFHLTGMGNGTDATDSATTQQVQRQAENYAAASGSSAPFNVALSPTVTALTSGLTVRFKANRDSIAATTLNVDSIGNKTLQDPAGNQIGAGDLKTNGVYTAVYDSVQDAFVLQTGGNKKTVFHANFHSWTVATATADTLVTGDITIVSDTTGMWASANNRIQPNGAFTGMLVTYNVMNPSTGGIAAGVRKDGTTANGSAQAPKTWEQGNDAGIVISDSMACVSFYDEVASGEYYQFLAKHAKGSDQSLVGEIYIEMVD